MQASPLQLENYYVESLRWSMVQDYEPDSALLVLQADDLKCEVQRADLEAPRYAAYRLLLSHQEPTVSVPYTWTIVLVGYFRLNDTVAEDDVELVMDANAPAVLFGAAREALATTLSRGPYRAPILPSVNFINLQRLPNVVVEQGKRSGRRKASTPSGDKAATAKTTTQPVRDERLKRTSKNG